MTTSGDVFRKALERQAEQQAAFQKMLSNVVPKTLPRTLPPDALKSLKNRSMADTLYDDTKAQIEKAQSQLEEGEQLIVFCIGPAGAPIIISDLGYHNPNMMIAWGNDLEGNDCSIIMHMASFSVELKVVAIEPDMPRRQVGFVAPTKTTE